MANFKLYIMSPCTASIGCLVTLPSAVYIPYPLHTHKHSHTHTHVCHPWWCEWSLYGHGSRGHLVFFPTQLLKCKHSSCLDLPNEHLVFQSGLLAVTFFSNLGWKARLFCIIQTYTQAYLHAYSLLFPTYVWWEWSHRVRPASRPTHKHTLKL